MPKVIDLPEVQQTLDQMNQIKLTVITIREVLDRSNLDDKTEKYHTRLLLRTQFEYTQLQDSLIKVLLREVEQNG